MLRVNRRRSSIFIVNFEHISHLVLVFLLITLRLTFQERISASVLAMSWKFFVSTYFGIKIKWKTLNLSMFLTLTLFDIDLMMLMEHIKDKSHCYWIELTKICGTSNIDDYPNVDTISDISYIIRISNGQLTMGCRAINPYWPNCSSLYPLKTSQNRKPKVRFSVSEGYKNGTLR